MRSNTIIYLRWKLSGRIEHFVNLGKLYSHYNSSNLGVTRSMLNKRDLLKGYENDTIEILKSVVK